MPEFFVTFGQQYGREDHPPHPRLPFIAHRDGWVTIVADSHDKARELAFVLCDRNFSDVYPAEHFDPSFYPLGERLRVIDPACQQPVALYHATNEGWSNLLLTQWADGRLEVAGRVTAVDTWSPPWPAERRPL